jgi:hypothetical protein
MEYTCELTRLLKTKSTILYRPPNGTDGLERNTVSGKSRSPLPPARTNARIFGCDIMLSIYGKSFSEKLSVIAWFS